MLPLRDIFNPRLPEGYVLKVNTYPSPEALNKLLSSCKEATHPSKRLSAALRRSSFCLSIFEESNERLMGFVRATSDKGLNANLWNLVATPGEYQDLLLLFLVHHSLRILRREMPGCSISVSAPSVAITALLNQGFLLDPNGIRAMGLRL